MILILSIKLISAQGDVKFKAYGNEVDERFAGEYEEGDKFRIELSDSTFMKVALDELLPESIVYVPDGSFEFVIPFGYERKACYAPGTFAGEDHRVRVSEPTEAEIYGDRMISLNTHDRHNVPKYFPHAVANFVTREEPCFFESSGVQDHVRLNF